VSIDEISMRKGKGSFVTVVSDIEAGNLIEMIDSHRQQDIIDIMSGRLTMIKLLPPATNRNESNH
jgi:hypothetical protein